MRKLLQLAILLLLGNAFPAMAACTASSVSAAFTSASSFTVNTTASNTNTTLTINCGAGAIIALLTGDTVSLKLTGASPTATTLNRGAMGRSGETNSIPVQLCTVDGCGTELILNSNTVTYSKDQLAAINIGGSTNVIFSIPVWLRTVPGAIVSAGTYSGTLSILVTYNVCTGIGLLGGCLLGAQQTGTLTLPLTVTMVISNDCTAITAPAISFGSAPLVSSFTTISQTLNVICTKNSTYTVGMSNGLNNSGGTQRYMLNTTNSSAKLAYEIYQGSTTASRWGSNVTAERVPSSAATTVSTDGLTRTFSYNARVLTTQTTPVQGSYTDTITVDLSF